MKKMKFRIVVILKEQLSDNP